MQVLGDLDMIFYTVKKNRAECMITMNPSTSGSKIFGCELLAVIRALLCLAAEWESRGNHVGIISMSSFAV